MYNLGLGMVVEKYTKFQNKFSINEYRLEVKKISMYTRAYIMSKILIQYITRSLRSSEVIWELVFDLFQPVTCNT